MYSESIKIGYELRDCVLKDVVTGKELMTFDARAVATYASSGGMEGSGIASGGHNFTIATAKVFDYEPYNQAVVIQGVSFIILAKRILSHVQRGECYMSRGKCEIVLELQ